MLDDKPAEKTYATVNGAKVKVTYKYTNTAQVRAAVNAVKLPQPLELDKVLPALDNNPGNAVTTVGDASLTGGRRQEHQRHRGREPACRQQQPLPCYHQL